MAGKEWIDINDTMSLEEVKKEASPSMWSPRMGPNEIIQSHVGILQQKSNEAKESVDWEEAVVYGPGPKQKIDIFGHKSLPTDSPIFVFFHGGYWQIEEIGRTNSSYMAKTFVSQGVVFITAGYDLAITVSMEELLHQTEEAVKYVLKFAKERGSSGVYVGGHSAGGQITAMLMHSDFGEYDSLLKGFLPISGVFDLRFLVTTHENEALKLSKSQAWEYSPAKFIEMACRKSTDRIVYVAVGEHDSNEFKRQSKLYEKCLRESGVSTKFILVQNTDHFNIVENLKDQDYILTKRALEMMAVK